MGKTVLKVVLLSACLLLPGAARAAELDGTSWKMRFRSAKAWLHVWKGDVMRFDDGKFGDTECGSYGFPEAAYGLLEKAGRKSWRATRYNEDGERTDWEGVLDGDKMTGTFTWSRPDGTSRTYKFSARRKDQRAASKG